MSDGVSGEWVASDYGWAAILVANVGKRATCRRGKEPAIGGNDRLRERRGAGAESCVMVLRVDDVAASDPTKTGHQHSQE